MYMTNRNLHQYGHSQKDRKLVFKTNHRLMPVKSIAGEHSAILLTFTLEHSAIRLTFIKLPFVNKTFVLAILVAILHRFYCTMINKENWREMSTANCPSHRQSK